MTPVTVLVKSIALLYRESQLGDVDNNSNDLVKTALEVMKLEETRPGLVSQNQTLYSLRDIVLQYLDRDMEDPIDTASVVHDLSMACKDDPRLLQAALSGVENHLEIDQIRRTVSVLKKHLSNYFREEKITEVLRRASVQFPRHRGSVKKGNAFLAGIINELSSLEFISSSVDPSLVDEVDLGDPKALALAVGKTLEANSSDGIMKTGCTALNKMCQGGFRRGEMITWFALKHNYKTGQSLTLFKQIAMLNEPYMLDVTKKPLLLRISFEDPLSSNLMFLYTNLKYNETREFVDISAVSETEMSEYIQKSLGSTGYHIKLLRIDPSEWGYKDLFNKIVQLESEGYEIHLLMLDYLSMMSKSGCNTNGGFGTDLRDLFRRVRNFCSARKITVFTPHQLSTDANELIRQGTPGHKFVKMIPGRAYHADSRQIDQEIDLELNGHICKNGSDSFLAVSRGKHRLPSNIPDKHKFFMLPFPELMPIPDDLPGEDMSVQTYIESKKESGMFD